jgi:hypothetical protein
MDITVTLGDLDRALNAPVAAVGPGGPLDIVVSLS